MTRANASQKRRTKASQRRRRPAAARLQRDLAQAQQAAQIWEQALDALGLPANLVAEIDGRLRSQHKLLGQIVGVLCPPLCGGRTNPARWRGRGGDKHLPSRLRGAAQALLEQAAPQFGPGGAATALALRRQEK